MRLIKTIGLALVATCALALASSATASANTILCHLGASAGHCPGGELPFTGPIAALGTFQLLSALTNVSCHLVVQGNISSAGGLAVNPKGAIEKATWSTCSSGCGVATAGEIKLPWSFEVLGTGTLNSGSIDVSGHGFWFQSCGMKCEYQATFASLGLIGGNAAGVVANEVEVSKIGGPFLCPNTAEWHGELALSPSHLTVHRLSGGSVLCHLGSTAEHCPSGELPFTGTISALGKFEALSGFDCHLALEGKITSAGGLTTNPKGSIEKATWKECAPSGCGGTLTVEALNLPWSVELLGTSSLNAGTAHVSNFGYRFEICGLVCEFSSSLATLEFSGGSTAELKATNVPLKKSGGSVLCAESTTWSAALPLTPEHLSLHQL